MDSSFACFLVRFFSFAEELEEEKENPTETELTEKQKHQLRHRELFLSRQYESLPATHIRYRTKTLTPHHLPAVSMKRRSSSHEQRTNCSLLTSCVCVLTWCLSPPSLSIRGKCSVALLNETEAVLSYLDKEVSQIYLLCHLLPVFTCRRLSQRV